MTLAVLLLLLGEAQFSLATCDAKQLNPCLSALTFNLHPPPQCCERLNQQKPCFCQYVKNPKLKDYLVNSAAAKKVYELCKVTMPKFHENCKNLRLLHHFTPSAKPTTYASTPTTSSSPTTPALITTKIIIGYLFHCRISPQPHTLRREATHAGLPCSLEISSLELQPLPFFAATGREERRRKGMKVEVDMGRRRKPRRPPATICFVLPRRKEERGGDGRRRLLRLISIVVVGLLCFG
nr:non-specific lipid-transfer protein 2-like [Ipomoea batatas]